MVLYQVYNSQQYAFNNQQSKANTPCAYWGPYVSPPAFTFSWPWLCLSLIVGVWEFAPLCRNTQNGGLFMMDNYTAAETWFNASFPDWSVEMAEADVARGRWTYTLRLYMRQGNNQHGNMYTYAGVYVMNQTQNLCYQYEVCQCCCNSCRYLTRLSHRLPGSLCAQVNPPWGSEYQGMGSTNMPAEVALNAIHSALYREVSQTNDSILTTYVAMPKVVYVPAVPAGAIGLQTLLVPLFTSLMWPQFVSFVSQEKETLLLQMMKMAGLRMMPYWFACYLFCFVITLLISLILDGFAFLFNVATFTNASFSLFFGIAVLWAHASTGYAFFLGAVVRHSRPATILAYLIIIFAAVTAMILNQFVTHWPSGLSWVPFLSYSRTLYLLLKYGGSSIVNGSELQLAFVSTFLTGTIGLVLGIYLYAVLPGVMENSGTPESPLFCLSRFFGSGGGNTAKKVTGTVLRMRCPTYGCVLSLSCWRGSVPADATRERLLQDGSASYQDQQGEGHELEDVDVQAERMRVLSRQLPAATAIEIRNLVKVGVVHARF